MGLMTTGTLRQKLTGLRLLLLLSALLVLPLFLASTAQAKYASIIIDANSARVLHAVNAKTQNFPASLTKMMTLMMLFDALKSGSISLKTHLPVSSRAAGQAPSKLGLRKGDTITARDAILALITKSANDVAVVVAEALGGTEAGFARKMTSKARKIGMSKTTFYNASGLPNRRQLSTAHDMAILARVLLTDFGTYYGYFSTKYFTYRGTRYGNHNGLLGNYEGTDGIKTGYIRASGFNLVASVQRNGTRLIGVVFGGRTGRSRDSHMITLLNKGFAQMNKAVLANLTPPLPTHRLSSISLLQQQAITSKGFSMNIADAAPPTQKDSKPNRLNAQTEEQGSAKDAPAAATGDWGIQVGAYATPGPAWDIAAKAAAATRHLLNGGGVIKVVPLPKKGGRKLYRAQILGISEQQSRQSCTYLERRKINCMSLRMKEPFQVASRDK
jgi:D-alanyl-D-alanine carboxypeptidase